MAITIFQKAGDCLVLYVCALCETTPEMYSISMSPFLTVRFTSRELIQGRGPVHSLQKWAASHLL